MTRDDALTSIFNSHIVEKIASRYSTYTGELHDDFVQFIYLYLCELKEDKIVGLVERNEIDFYLLYVCKAQATNPLSAFNIQHKGRIQTTTLEENNNNDEDTESI